MTYPKIKPCLRCKNTDMSLYGYGDYGPLNWHVECEECNYLGPCGNKLQAIRLHNAAVSAQPARLPGESTNP